MGKFICKFGDAKMAIPYLLCAKELECVDKHKFEESIYYNLYKCYVKLEDYKNTFMSLYTCKELSADKGDLSLALNMLASITDMEKDFDFFINYDYIAENNKLFYKDLYNSYYCGLYKSIVESFNAKDYEKILEDLNLLKFSVDNSKYPIVVDSLVLLGTTLKQKKEKQYLNILENNEENELSLDRYLEIARELLESGMPIKSFFVDIEKYIKTDLEKAQAIYDLICSMVFPYYDVEKEYLKNAIREQKESQSLPESIALEYDKLKDLADKAFLQGNFILAEEKYREAFSISMLSISNYYIGKVLFKQGKISQAKKYFDNYLLNGGSNYDKCLLYLSSINHVFKRDALAKKQVRLMERLNDSFERDFNYKGFGSSYSSKCRDVNPEFDQYKNSVSKHIDMKEEDFVSEEDEFSVEDFYDCDLDCRLSIVRSCLRHGHTDNANHLLDNIGLVYNFEDIDKVNQF